MPILPTLLLACHSPPPTGEPTDTTTPETHSGTVSTTTDDTAETAVPPVLPEQPTWVWSFPIAHPSVRIVDLDADGDLDAIEREAVVTGSLLADRILPDDADARFVGGSWSTLNGLGDADGDGMLDAEINPGSGLSLVLGPFVGEVDVVAAGMPLPGTVGTDIDGDGLLDLTTTTDLLQRFTRGPASRWGGPPDLTLTPPACGRTPTTWNGWSQRPSAYPDVTGDGVRELLVGVAPPDLGSSTTYHDCERLLLPLPSGGTVDPQQVPGVVIDPPPFSVIPDQSGDGRPDVLSGRRVYVAPVTFQDHGGITAAESWDVAPTFPIVTFSELDLDGDGIGEVLLSDDTVSIVVPGGPGIATATLDDAWQGRRFDVTGGWPLGLYVEDGTAFLLGSRSYEITLFELGPAL